MTHPIRGSRPVLALAAAVLVLAGCKDEKKLAATPPLPPGTQPIAESARLAAPPATETCYSSPVRIVFYSAYEWLAYWRGNNPTCTPPPVPAGVDFAHEMLVYASIGKRMSPEDRISIDGSGIRNDSVIVAVRRFVRKEGCPGPKQATFPQSLVKLPADKRPVHFSEAHVTIPCDADQGSAARPDSA